MNAVEEVARPVFTLTPVIPLDKEFLREMLRLAMTNTMCVPMWALIDSCEPESGPAYYIREKEWAEGQPQPTMRVDLYTIQRGLTKVFEAKYNIHISTRQMVLRALFEQAARPCVFAVAPFALSAVVQLAVFDQVVY